MDISEFRERAMAFEPGHEALKLKLAPKSEWYPYETTRNWHVLNALLSGEHRELSKYLDSGPVADIGAADGDLAFLLGSLGYAVDIIDNGPTNFNGLRGARMLAEELGGRIAVHEVDLDSQFQLPRQYGVAFFLGILYHLQNPFYALKRLAASARYAFISTKIAQVTTDGRVRLEDAPVAYLLAAGECNDDPTNYWVFSEAGLRRLLDRTGWEILDFSRGGCSTDSNPSSMDRDERAFCFVRSKGGLQ